MKSDQAIIILQNAKLKISSLNEENFRSYTAQLTAYSERFFGSDSAQYVYMNNADYVIYNRGTNEWVINNSKPALSSFIDDCIESIRNTGIKKKEWKHILITTHPAIFWAAFVGLMSISFGLGKCTANKSSNATTYNSPNKNEKIQMPIRNKILDTAKFSSPPASK